MEKGRSKALDILRDQVRAYLKQKYCILYTLPQTDQIAEQTVEIISAIEGKEFTPITGPKLLDRFFVEFLKQQGLRLEGAKDIKSLQGSQGEGPSKA